MRGYGAPTHESSTASLSSPDWGYGDPSPSSWGAPTLDYGFGSSRTSYVDPFILSDFLTVGDDGGYKIRIKGVFPRLGAGRRQRPTGFEVVLVSTGGTEYLCYSGRAGDGLNCSTDLNARVLDAFTPRLATGAYSVKIRYNNEELDAGSVTVVRRLRSLEEYALKSALPNTHNVGGRSASFDLLLDSSAPSARSESLPVLSALLRAWGQSLQELKGRKSTRLTQALDASATQVHVESTLYFPDAGSVFVGGVLIKYTSKTTTQLNGVTRPRGQMTTINKGTLLILEDE